MGKLIVVAVGVLLALAITPASAASKRSQCYVVHGSGKYGSSGDPVGRCSRMSKRSHYTVGKNLGTRPASARCMGKPRGYKFIRWEGGQPRLVTCLGAVG